MLLSGDFANMQLCRDIGLNDLFVFEQNADVAALDDLLCGIDVQNFLDSVLETPYFEEFSRLVRFVYT